MVIKLAALAACGLLAGGSSASAVCTCPPPEVETISCTDGAVSWPAAACTQTQVAPNMTQVDLTCPPAETAISAGFRHLAGPPRPLLDMSPVVPAGGHAHTYRFTWRSAGGTVLRPYITCERL